MAKAPTDAESAALTAQYDALCTLDSQIAALQSERQGYAAKLVETDDKLRALNIQRAGVVSQCMNALAAWVSKK